MAGSLGIVVYIDLDGHHVLLEITGSLTARTQCALYPVIRRARLFNGGVPVTVDLRRTHVPDPCATDLLRWVVTDDTEVVWAGPVLVLDPDADSDQGRDDDDGR
jgi:hypothetical protein